jgi:hypothetical protein
LRVRVRVIHLAILFTLKREDIHNGSTRTGGLFCFLLTSCKIGRRDKTKKINVANQVQLPLSENILRSWEMRRFADPQLFGLSQVVLAVPPTQVSVERAFSAL